MQDAYRLKIEFTEKLGKQKFASCEMTELSFLLVLRKVETLFRTFTHPAVLFTIAMCINGIFFAKGGRFYYKEL